MTGRPSKTSNTSGPEVSGHVQKQVSKWQLCRYQLGRAAIKGDHLEEAGSCSLKVGGAGWWRDGASSEGERDTPKMKELGGNGH